MKSRCLVACYVCFLTTVATAPAAFAQNATPGLPFNIGDAVRQTNEAARHAPVSRSSAPLVLPHLAEPQLKLNDKETLFVRTFKVEGPNVVADAELHDILAPYESRKLTLAQIYEAADQITTLYRNKGYLVAKAYVPAQDARHGVLRIKVVPGKYGNITVQNDSLVRQDYLQAVIDHALAGSSFVQKDPLERAMLLTSDLPGAGMPRAAIGAGQIPETSDFTFGVPAGRRIDGYLLGDNFGSPFTGRDRLSGGFNLNSPLGIGDRLSAFGIISENHEIENGRIPIRCRLGTTGCAPRLPPIERLMSSVASTMVWTRRAPRMGSAAPSPIR
jgi:hemolysin activation/secretion protein